MNYISPTGWDITRADFRRKRSVSIPKAFTVAALTVAIAVAGFASVTTLQQMSGGLTTKLASVPAAAASIHRGADALRARADAVATSGVPVGTAEIAEAQRAELIAGGASRVVPCGVISPDLAAVADVLDISCGIQ